MKKTDIRGFCRICPNKIKTGVAKNDTVSSTAVFGKTSWISADPVWYLYKYKTRKTSTPVHWCCW